MTAGRFLGMITGGRLERMSSPRIGIERPRVLRRAIALLKPKVKVIGIVCATENMPSGKAQKPGDVQIAMSGKSIEIINTDAEGRLVLADGLFYAKQPGCTHLVDAATLTGSIVVALGFINVGVFGPDDGPERSAVAAPAPTARPLPAAAARGRG